MEIRDVKKNSKVRQTMDRELLVKLLWCLGLSLYWVVFLWGFWNKGVFALGVNAFVFCLLVLGLFWRELRAKKRYVNRDLLWLIPLGLLALSYLLYDNPFIKTVNMLIYPLLFVLFFNFGFLSNKEKRSWNLNFASRFLSRFFSVLGNIGAAVDYYFELVLPKSMKKKQIIKKIIIGLVLFLVLAFAVVLPLLSSADAEFSSRVQVFYDWIKNFISIDLVYKVIVFCVLSLGILSALLAWGSSFDYEEKETIKKQIDPIVSGIVIGGILCLYLLFLWVQIGRLWVGSLPFDFRETENIVKSGFWQLFFLSLINILIYFFTYRKTNRVVQKILLAFTAASLLLLVSAGERMGLYVTYYGFSYEKFFASYTVIYSAILFIWLIYRLFRKQRANILKFLVVLFLWMFAIVAVFPVEQFIFRANLRLSELKDSRIRLFEMTMLSPDVLGIVKASRDQGKLTEKADYLEREDNSNSEDTFDWSPWIEKQEKRLADKKWYEKNIMNYLN